MNDQAASKPPTEPGTRARPSTYRPPRHPMIEMLLARLREFYRTPSAVFWVYVFPLIMTMALGTAFRNRSIEQIRVDIQAGPRSEALAKALATDPRLVANVLPESDCRNRLRTGKTDLVVVPEDARDDKPNSFQYHYDPTKPGSLLARNTVDDTLQRASGRQDVVAFSDHEMNDPGGRYIDFLVPGLLGMGIMGGGLWGVGFATVDMRIRKLLKRFLATPMKRHHFLAAIMASRLLFSIPEIVVLLVFSRLAFGVVNHGSYLVVAFLIVLGAVEFAGIGLLVASRAQTLETVSGLMNLVMLPMWMASGIFFSPDRFPAAVQPLIRILPLTPLNRALRSVMLEGAPLASLVPDLTIMAAWGAVTFVIALRIFRWN